MENPIADRTTRNIFTSVFSGLTATLIAFISSITIDHLSNRGEIQMLSYHDGMKPQIILTIDSWRETESGEFKFLITDIGRTLVAGTSAKVEIKTDTDNLANTYINVANDLPKNTLVIALTPERITSGVELRILKAPNGYKLASKDFSYRYLQISVIVNALFYGILFAIFTYLRTNWTDKLRRELDQKQNEITEQQKALRNQTEETGKRIESLSLFLRRRIIAADTEIELWRRIFERLMFTYFDSHQKAKMAIAKILGPSAWGKDREDEFLGEITDGELMLLFEKMRENRGIPK